MSKKQGAIVDALESSSKKQGGGFHKGQFNSGKTLFSDADAVFTSKGAVVPNASRGAATSLGRTDVDERQRHVMPELDFSSSGRPKSDLGPLPALEVPKQGTFEKFSPSSLSSASGRLVESRGKVLVRAARDGGPDNSTPAQPPKRLRSLLLTNQYPKSSTSSDRIYEPPAKRRAMKKAVGVSANDPVCVDDSSGDEEMKSEPATTSSERKSSEKSSSSGYFPAPEPYSKTLAASSGASNTSSTGGVPPRYNLFNAEKVCIGTLPGCVVGPVTLLKGGGEPIVRFTMTVNSSDLAVAVPLKFIISWEYGTDVTTSLLRFKLTAGGAGSIRTRSSMTFKKEFLNPELRDDCLERITFFLSEPLTSDEEESCKDLATKANANLTEKPWVVLSPVDVMEFVTKLDKEAENALKAAAKAASFAASDSRFYEPRRSSRATTRLSSLQTDYSCLAGKYSSDMSPSSSLEPGYKRPVPSANPQVVLEYAPQPASGTVTVTSNDMLCLKPQEFLNDTIMEFYLKYVFYHLPEERQSKVHMFNSFFYQSLTNRAPGRSAGSNAANREMHDRVKKWTRAVDIFDKDFVFVPINEHAHWFLAVICFPGADGPVFHEDDDPSATGSDSTPGGQTDSSSQRSYKDVNGNLGPGSTSPSPSTSPSQSSDCNGAASPSSSPAVTVLVNDSTLTDTDMGDDVLQADTSTQEGSSPFSTPAADGEREKMATTSDTGASSADGWDRSSTISESPLPSLEVDEPMDGSSDDGSDLGDDSDNDVRLLSSSSSIDRCAGRANTPPAIVVESSIDASSLQSVPPRGPACSKPVSAEDAAVLCSQSDAEEPEVLTVNRSLGRSMTIGTDRSRERLDDTLFTRTGDSDTAVVADLDEDEDDAFVSPASPSKKKTLRLKRGKGRGRPPINRPRNGGPRLKSQPCILVFDSLGSRSRNRVFTNLRNYLAEEWQAKRGSSRSFGTDVIKCGYPKVPQQDNYCDCGLFVLQYFECMLENPIPDYRLPMNLTSWFSQERVSKKRLEITSLIYRTKDS